MKIHRLVIYKKPVRWHMGLFAYIDKKTGKPRARMYPAADFKEWKRLIWGEATAAGIRPTEGPVSISVNYFCDRTGTTKQITCEGVRVSDGPIPRIVTPDLTNLTKAIEDGLIGIAYKDDRQVFQHADEGKWFVERGGVQRIEITVIQYDVLDEFEIGPDGSPRLKSSGGGEPSPARYLPPSSLPFDIPVARKPRL